jgi:hypothetical protein
VACGALLDKKIELKKNPFPLILSRGDPLFVLQILATIDRLGTGHGFNSLTAVVSTQRKDAGFPRNLQKGSPSSVKTTYRVLRTLNTVGVDKRSHIMTSALNWLLNWQESDGGWHENITIDLPKWMTWESTSQSVTWYTCQIGKLLLELKMQNTKAFKKIIDFLVTSELPTGGWSAVVGLDGPDPDSTAGIGDFLSEVLGRRHPAASRARKIFDRSMDNLVAKVKRERVEDAYELTHLIFEKRPNLMYRKGDERVSTLLKTLIEAQRNDGGWITFYSEGKPDVPISVFSLQVLLFHGIVEKSSLQNMFDATQ